MLMVREYKHVDFYDIFHILAFKHDIAASFMRKRSAFTDCRVSGECSGVVALHFLYRPLLGYHLAIYIIENRPAVLPNVTTVRHAEISPHIWISPDIQRSLKCFARWLWRQCTSSGARCVHGSDGKALSTRVIISGCVLIVPRCPMQHLNAI